MVNFGPLGGYSQQNDSSNHQMVNFGPWMLMAKKKNQAANRGFVCLLLVFSLHLYNDNRYRNYLAIS